MAWTRGRTIGRGSSATVSIAMAHGSGQVLAVKSTELAQSEFLQREQRTLSTLDCPQIVAYRGCDITCENGGLLYNVFMEYAPDGTLVDAIRSQGGHLDEATIKVYTRSILLGLQYLHANGIVHCDIKGRNLLVTNDGLKIADLGCARRVDDVSSAGSSIAGTPVFMAPEVARGEEQGFPADVWALGCTVIEMATGRAPWPDVSDPVSALYRIGFSGDIPEAPIFMSKQAKDFLDKCLKRDPVDRWSACELLKHAFLEDPISPSQQVNNFNSDTPTSVLDQGFWESMGEAETTPEQTHKSSLEAPLETIGQLRSEISMTSSQRMPNWVWDEQWVTVRSNRVKEPDNVNRSQDCDLLNANEPATAGGTETRRLIQPNELVYSSEPTSTSRMEASNMTTPRSSSSSSSSRNRPRKVRNMETCKRSVTLMAYECRKEASKVNKDVPYGKVHPRITNTCFLHAWLLACFPTHTIQVHACHILAKAPRQCS